MEPQQPEEAPNFQPEPSSSAQPSENQAPQPSQPKMNQESPSPAPAADSDARKKRLPKWLKIVGIVVIVILLLIVLLVLLVNLAANNAVNVSNQLVADIQTNNESGAYNLTTSGFKKATSSSQLSSLLNRVSPALQGQTHIVGKAINTVSGQPEEAVIVYSVSTGSGTKYIRVVLYNNHPWQVQNFRTSNRFLSISATN